MAFPRMGIASLSTFSVASSRNSVSKLVATLLLMGLAVASLASDAAAGDSLCMLKGIPSSPDELTASSCAYKLVVMAQGESEGIPLKLAKENTTTGATIVAAPGDLTVDLYWVKSISDAGNSSDGVFDPMLPLYVSKWEGGVCTREANKFKVPDDPGTYLLWLKITTVNSTSAGARQIVLTCNEETQISVPVTVCDMVLPNTPQDLPVTNMANLSWGDPNHAPYARDKDLLFKDLLQLLKDYRINATGGFFRLNASHDSSCASPTWNCTSHNSTPNQNAVKKFKNFLEMAPDYLIEIRIPAEELFNHADGNTFSEKCGNCTTSDDVYAAWLDRQRDYLNEVDDALSSSGLSFSYKIWDEPYPEHYAEVKKLYSLMHEGLDLPDLSYELTEPPISELYGSDSTCPVDVWTMGTTPLVSCSDTGCSCPGCTTESPCSDYASCIEYQHNEGKKVRLYANEWLGVNKPAYTARIIGWVLWYFGMDGYYFIGMNRWDTDPWSAISPDSERPYHRTAIVYPDVSGCWCGQNGTPIPSLRLEAFRDGIEDLLILKEFKKLADQSRDQLEGRGKALEFLKSAFVDTVKPTLYEPKESVPPNMSYWHDSLLLFGKKAEARYNQWGGAAVLTNQTSAKVQEKRSADWPRTVVLTDKPDSAYVR